MQTNQNTQDITNNPTFRDAQKKLSALLDEAKKLAQDIDISSKESSRLTQEIKSKVDDSVRNAGQIFAGLDQIEKEASEDLDEFILRQAEDIASEEE